MKHFIITWTLAVVSSTAVFASPGVTTGNQLQAVFGSAIESRKASRVMLMLSAQIRGRVDEAVLQRLLDQIRTKLGRATSTKQTSVRSVRESGRHTINSQAEVAYEKGSARIRLKSVDGKLVGFDFESKELGVWFDKPASTEPYEQMGTTFVRNMLLGSETRALKMLHPTLQKQLGADFETMCAAARKTIKAENELKIGVRRSRMVQPKKRDSAPTLLIDLGLTNGETTGTCEIQIQFVGMQGHLTGFQFNK